MKYAVITGVSKGLGESIAEYLLESGVHVIGISRTGSTKLNKQAKSNNVTFTHFPCDLSNATEIENTYKEISEEVFTESLSTIYLVNNAAVLEPINPSMNIKSKDLAYHMQVNTVAPMILTNLFLKVATEKDVSMIGVTVTSGAAERPVYGWSAYCSSKASINRYTETVALEQDELKTGHKLIAFNPGVMDTEMQEKIRSTSQYSFIDVDTFKDYKKNNFLKDTVTVAGILVDILTDERSIKNGEIYNANDYF
ncbi:(S)-benzoin forming benzil reductase [Virgibacillus necropolis]|uniref:Short-chain dehydrogenase n=1 Tax=Virgibacillus necropolis TaxID=163877 RepID=A0A221MG21_9BACI|nr:(S)-benzoin forming benzil reductase [Virgibacillus necropolis]ASN06618.1 short-chain dehydrogenase [Virgibacillus necropolis]